MLNELSLLANGSPISKHFKESPTHFKNVCSHFLEKLYSDWIKVNGATLLNNYYSFLCCELSNSQVCKGQHRQDVT